MPPPPPLGPVINPAVPLEDRPPVPAVVSLELVPAVDELRPAFVDGFESLRRAGSSALQAAMKAM
jgi:hypothetical protein